MEFNFCLLLKTHLRGGSTVQLEVCEGLTNYMK
jgi:hypothetical protein